MQRNPYVILGIPFGGSRDQATSAFTVKAKRLRRDPNGGALLTELTWALNQVTDVVKDPSLAIDVYRVPADPAALEPDASGIFAPPPERMMRLTGPSTVAHQRVTAVAAREGIVSMYKRIGRQSLLPSR